jgi:hypothetical protein
VPGDKNFDVLALRRSIIFISGQSESPSAQMIPSLAEDIKDRQ